MLIYGAHRVLDDERLFGLQQPRDCVKDLKDVLKQRLAMETSQDRYCYKKKKYFSVNCMRNLTIGLGWTLRLHFVFERRTMPVLQLMM